MQLDENSDVYLDDEEDMKLPKYKFEFKSISDLKLLEKNTLVGLYYFLLKIISI